MSSLNRRENPPFCLEKPALKSRWLLHSKVCFSYTPISQNHVRILGTFLPTTAELTLVVSSIVVSAGACDFVPVLCSLLEEQQGCNTVFLAIFDSCIRMFQTFLVRL